MKSPKKVLFIARYLWGDEGISVHLIRLAQGLIQLGWEVGLVSAIPSTGPDNPQSHTIEKFTSCGMRYFYVPFPKSINHPSKIPQFSAALTALSQVIQQFQPDLLHIHSLSVSPYAHILRLRHGLPFVSTAHIEPKIKPRTALVSRLFNRLFPHAFGDRFIAISTAIEQTYINDLNVDHSRINLIYHGFDIEHFRPPSDHERLEARKYFDLPHNANVVCLIGRLDPVKGHQVLYQALAELKEQGVQIFAICAGTGGDWENQIKAQPKELGIDNLVQFPGFVDARKVLWACDAIVLPSQREGFPLVIPEAMLCGVVPIRTPAAGACDQIIDQVNGFIVPFNDPTSLASVLQTLLTQDSLKAAMSEAAMDFATSNFSDDAMLAKTIETYSEVIKEK